VALLIPKGKRNRENKRYLTRKAIPRLLDQKPAFGGKLEARNPKFETSGAYGENFVKQTQFAPGNIDVTSVLKRHYDNTAHPETAGNKANEREDKAGKEDAFGHIMS